MSGRHGMDWFVLEAAEPEKEIVSTLQMKIVSKHIIKGSVRLYTMEQYCSRTLSRDMLKFVQKRTRTCGICITSFER